MDESIFIRCLIIALQLAARIRITSLYLNLLENLEHSTQSFGVFQMSLTESHHHIKSATSQSTDYGAFTL